MDKNNFIYFKQVVKILENYLFFGFTAKRNKNTNRILYTYRSVKYPNILVQILTMKLEPDKIQSDKIILGVKFNNTEINGWNDFILNLKSINKINKKIDTTLTIIGLATSAYEIMQKTFKWYENKHRNKKQQTINASIIKGTNYNKC